MASKEKYILAIDHGTSAAKVAIVTVHGKTIDFVIEEFPLYIFEDGGAEQDPDEWWDGIVNASKKLLEKELVLVEDIVGVCNTSQWSGTVAIDKDGNHLMNAIIWMDSRGAPILEKLNDEFPKVEGYSLRKIIQFLYYTGGGPSSSGKDPTAHILWLKYNRPEIYENTYKFLEPHDWVNMKLTGKIASSESNIQLHWITNNRDINNIHYSKRMLKMLKFDPNKFPILMKSADVLGPVTNKVADLIGLERGTKVVIGAPDIHTGVIGAGAIEDYKGMCSIGTSDFVLCHVPFRKTNISTNIGSFPSFIPGKYLMMNEQEFAGANLVYLKNNLLYHKDELLVEEAVPDVFKIFDKIAEKIPAGAGNVIYCPHLMGERSPVSDYTSRSGLYNLSLDTTREQIIRAIFEGVAYNVRWLQRNVEKFIKRKMPEINLIGGGAQSDIWCQIFADVHDRVMHQVKNPRQAGSRGAAFIASVGLGYMDWEDIPKYIEISNTFKPNPENRALYDRLFKEYVNIYKEMNKIYRRLNKDSTH